MWGVAACVRFASLAPRNAAPSPGMNPSMTRGQDTNSLSSTAMRRRSKKVSTPPTTTVAPGLSTYASGCFQREKRRCASLGKYSAGSEIDLDTGHIAQDVPGLHRSTAIPRPSICGRARYNDIRTGTSGILSPVPGSARRAAAFASHWTEVQEIEIQRQRRQCILGHQPHWNRVEIAVHMAVELFMQEMPARTVAHSCSVPRPPAHSALLAVMTAGISGTSRRTAQFDLDLLDLEHLAITGLAARQVIEARF